MVLRWFDFLCRFGKCLSDLSKNNWINEPLAILYETHWKGFTKKENSGRDEIFWLRKIIIFSIYSDSFGNDVTKNSVSPLGGKPSAINKKQIITHENRLENIFLEIHFYFLISNLIYLTACYKQEYFILCMSYVIYTFCCFFS